MQTAEVFELVAGRCLTPTAGGLVGVEVEWFPYRPDGSAERIPIDVVQAAYGGAMALPSGTAVTFEPGGQIELSGLPQLGAAAACGVLESDLTALRRQLEAAGIHLLGTGLHPQWAPERILAGPRYEAMEAYFDHAVAGEVQHDWGSAGRTMMTLTAAVQINVDLGPSPGRTWNLAHELGPVFVGAFANSPFARGRPTGFRSTRFANWWQLDPARTRPIATGGGAAASIARYALAAPVMGVFRDGDHRALEPVLGCLTFKQWIDNGYRGQYPDEDDFTYHLTTLFPPIRPRGWLELRMADALPGSDWRVPVALASALLTQPHRADPRLSVADGLWMEAARSGLSHPRVAEASRRAFATAAELLEGSPSERYLADVLRDYAERYVTRGRCPADDALDLWRRTGCVGAVGDRRTWTKAVGP